MNKIIVEKVYLVVHEFFGVSLGKQEWTLVTPDIAARGQTNHGHEYKLARFKSGQWVGKKTDLCKGTYSLEGVKQGYSSPLDNFSPCPPGQFHLDAKGGYCQWIVPRPSKIHQLRLVDIKESRPLFCGKVGSEVDANLEAASIVQVFEYVPNASPIQVVVTRENGECDRVELDYTADEITRTVNLHIWASLAHDSNTNDSEAIAHAKYVFGKLAHLIDGLEMHAASAVAVDATYSYQRPMPHGLRFAELLTLSEDYRVRRPEDHVVDIQCTPRTCGVAGNLFVHASTE